MDSLRTFEIYDQIKNFGISTITTEDLLSIIIRSDSREDDEVSDDFDLRDLAFLNFKELKDKTGICDNTIYKLLCSVELGNRVFKSCRLRYGQLTTSKEAGEISLSFFNNIYQECLVGFFLDVNRKLIKSEIIFKGTLDASIACPREILEFALKYHAHSFILAHNHPSGECSISPEDIRFTKKMNRAARIVGIEFTDHLIIGTERYLSLQEENLFS
ncbi:JAB domain-containing protein [Xylocopilactobacillus apis]|uniref:UPF0758 protein n=1 Tax=Xylocopilactobacillus apis TaxID=2932183 RepID=A0AAU9CY80_9LACO|nr:JAB domain-containing protein [Xylocopilactobacillus apis]BDR56203.1 UPF0758 protein [Xylocopilactobacillus apis]